MKLFVIGATGRTGSEVVEQAVARGHQVTAFVRSPESLKLKNERLTVINGDVMDEDQLANAMQNHDAVASALGPREVFKPSSLLRDSALATTHAMQHSGVRRLVVLSAAAHFPGIPNRIVSFILRNHMRDSLAMEEIVQGSRLDWTIARPPPSHPGRFLDLSKSRGRCAQDGFQSFPQSGCRVHARCDRAKETFLQNRRHREVTSAVLHVYPLRCCKDQPHPPIQRPIIEP